MLLLLVLACETAEPPHCEAFPDAPSTPATVLGNDDDCGYWTLAVGDQLVVSVYMNEADYRCEGEVGVGLELPYDPTYTNMADDGPKMTFQIEGIAPTGDGYGEVAITCEEGTEWQAHVKVE